LKGGKDLQIDTFNLIGSPTKILPLSDTISIHKLYTGYGRNGIDTNRDMKMITSWLVISNKSRNGSTFVIERDVYNRLLDKEKYGTSSSLSLLKSRNLNVNDPVKVFDPLLFDFLLFRTMKQ
jgi:hypothetical protein